MLFLPRVPFAPAPFVLPQVEAVGQEAAVLGAAVSAGRGGERGARQ